MLEQTDAHEAGVEEALNSLFAGDINQAVEIGWGQGIKEMELRLVKMGVNQAVAEAAGVMALRSLHNPPETPGADDPTDLMEK